MKRFGKSVTFLVALTILSLSMEDCSVPDRVVRVRDGKVIHFAEMIKDIRTVNVVFVGEAHSDKKHHQLQLAIIKELDRLGVPLAIGLEMFKTDNQRELDRWVTGSLGLNEFLKVYHDNWGLPWPLYRDIFLYSRNKRIPMVGLNVSSEIPQKVSREGFASLTDEDLKKLPPGISCDVDTTYMDFIRRAYTVHHADGKSFINFCEAQMVWDKAMAWNLAEFLRVNPSRTVIVLAGIGHSWKRGIPEQLERSSKLHYRVILPELPERTEKATLLIQDADYILPE